MTSKIRRFFLASIFTMATALLIASCEPLGLSPGPVETPPEIALTAAAETVAAEMAVTPTIPAVDTPPAAVDTPPPPTPTQPPADTPVVPTAVLETPDTPTPDEEAPEVTSPTPALPSPTEETPEAHTPPPPTPTGAADTPGAPTPTGTAETPGAPTPTGVAGTPATPAPMPTPEGQVLLMDDFEATQGWFVTNQANFRMQYAEGGYRILNNFDASFVNSVRSFDLADAYIEVDATQISGPDTGYYGLVCRWQNVTNNYGMVIGNDGFYGILSLQNGEVTFLGEGTLESGILNPDGSNRIAGSCIGNTLSLWVNGESVLNVQDDLYQSGSVGLMVGTRTGPVEVHFDNFVLVRP